MEGYIVSSTMGVYTFKNEGLRFERLGYMSSLIEGLFLTQDSVTVHVGDEEVTGSSYRKIYDELNKVLPPNSKFLDGARWW